MWNRGRLWHCQCCFWHCGEGGPFSHNWRSWDVAWLACFLFCWLRMLCSCIFLLLGFVVHLEMWDEGHFCDDMQEICISVAFKKIAISRIPHAAELGNSRNCNQKTQICTHPLYIKERQLAACRLSKALRVLHVSLRDPAPELWHTPKL